MPGCGRFQPAYLPNLLHEGRRCISILRSAIGRRARHSLLSRDERRLAAGSGTAYGASSRIRSEPHPRAAQPLRCALLRARRVLAAARRRWRAVLSMRLVLLWTDVRVPQLAILLERLRRARHVHRWLLPLRASVLWPGLLAKRLITTGSCRGTAGVCFSSGCVTSGRFRVTGGRFTTGCFSTCEG